MTISLDQAKAIAERRVRAIADACNDEFGIVGNETIDEGWLFYYNSKAFIETDNFRDALAGNGPIFVDRNGVVKVLRQRHLLAGRDQRLVDQGATSVVRMSEAISGTFIIIPRISLRSCGLLAGNANE